MVSPFFVPMMPRGVGLSGQPMPNFPIDVKFVNADVKFSGVYTAENSTTETTLLNESAGS